MDVRLHEAHPEVVVLAHPIPVEHTRHLISEAVPHPEQHLPPSLLLRDAAPGRRENRRSDLVRLQRLGHQLNLTERHQFDIFRRQPLPLEELPDLVVKRRAEGREPQALPPQIPETTNSLVVRRLGNHDGVQRVPGPLLTPVRDEPDPGPPPLERLNSVPVMPVAPTSTSPVTTAVATGAAAPK